MARLQSLQKPTLLKQQLRVPFEAILLKEELKLEYLLKFVFFIKTREVSTDLWKNPNLVDKLTDPDPLARWVSANFIGHKRIPARQELIECLSDPIPEVREAARRALVRQARGTDFGPQPLDSQAKIQQAIKRWNAWLAMQDPVTSIYRPASAAGPRPNPIPGDFRSIDKKKD